MKIADMISAAEARLRYLEAMRETATRHGDLAELARLDMEIAETRATLAAVQSLPCC